MPLLRPSTNGLIIPLVCNYHFSFFCRNYYLEFGLITETCLGVFLAYCPGLEGALRMYGLRYVLDSLIESSIV